jgi:hypothetical protein
VEVGPAEVVDPAGGFILTSVSSDRRTLALVNNETGTMRVLRVTADGSRIEARSEWPILGVYSAALSPDATLILVNCDGASPNAAAEKLCVYRTADGSVLRELPAEARGEAVWCADGHTAMTTNGTGTSTIWNTANWIPRCTLGEDLGGDITTFTLADNGRTALVFRDNWINVLSTSDGQVVARLELRDANGFCLAFREIAPGRFAALQIDGRLDLLDTVAWNTELTKLGLGW